MRNILKFVLLVPSFIIPVGCRPITEASLTATSIGNDTDTSVTYTAPAGTGYTSITVDQGSQFQATNVCNGATIFGLAGSARCLSSGQECASSGVNTVVSVSSVIQSGASRDSTTTQLTASQEATTYAGASLPSGYRDIPSVTRDDEAGHSSSVVTRLTRGTTEWNTGVPRVACGMGLATIEERIADCNTRHTTKPSWDAVSGDGRLSWSGSMSGNGIGPEGSWTLVNVYNSSLNNGDTCTSTCLEVWRDDRTGLLWSDRIGSPTSTTVNIGWFNWCIASGNMENSGADCSNGASGYNTASVSLCAEAPGLTTPVGTHNTTSNAAGSAPGATWSNTGTGVRDAKAGMMKTANTDPAGSAKSPSVRWRLPTRWDLEQADLDGIRLIHPRMYSTSGYLWTATIFASSRNSAYRAWAAQSDLGGQTRSLTYSVYCVGR